MGLGSGIRDTEKTYSGSRIPDPGVNKAPDLGSRIQIRNIEKSESGTASNKNQNPDP
jgi:hypothetical protein